jgi:acyl-CoA dehydrogenase
MSALSQHILGPAAADEPEMSADVQAMLAHMPAWAAAADRDGMVPDSAWGLVPARTLNRMNIPLALGGAAMTATAMRRAVVFERIGRICAALPMSLPGPGLSMPPVIALGTPEQKARYCAAFTQCDTPKWGAFAITEPRGGSDATGLRTQAVADGDDYVIDGEKCFITNGPRQGPFRHTRLHGGPRQSGFRGRAVRVHARPARGPAGGTALHRLPRA